MAGLVPSGQTATTVSRNGVKTDLRLPLKIIFGYSQNWDHLYFNDLKWWHEDPLRYPTISTLMDFGVSPLPLSWLCQVGPPSYELANKPLLLGG